MKYHENICLYDNPKILGLILMMLTLSYKTANKMIVPLFISSFKVYVYFIEDLRFAEYIYTV